MNIKIITLSAVLGFLGSASADLSSFRKALETDPASKFNWGLAAWRWFQGAAMAALAGGAADAR